MRLVMGKSREAPVSRTQLCGILTFRRRADEANADNQERVAKEAQRKRSVTEAKRKTIPYGRKSSQPHRHCGVVEESTEIFRFCTTETNNQLP